MIGDGLMGWPSTAKIKQRPTDGVGDSEGCVGEMLTHYSHSQ